MRFLKIILLLTLVLPVGCGGGGGATAPNVFIVPTSLTLTADYPTLAVDTATLTTTIGHYAGSADQNLTGSVVLSSSNGAVASVTASTILAVGPGTADITATWSNSNGDVVTTILPVTVTNATVDALTVTPGTASVDPGADQLFSVSADFSDSSRQVLFNNLVTWASDAPLIATVNTDGEATGVSYGDATISASFGGQSDDAILTVNVVLASITLAGPAHLNEGDTVYYTVTGVYTDSSTIDLTNAAETLFATDQPDTVAFISNRVDDDKGALTGFSAVNPMEVSVTYGSFSDSMNVVIFLIP